MQRECLDQFNAIAVEKSDWCSVVWSSPEGTGAFHSLRQIYFLCNFYIALSTLSLEDYEYTWPLNLFLHCALKYLTPSNVLNIAHEENLWVVIYPADKTVISSQNDWLCEVHCKNEIIISQQSTELLEKLMQDRIKETNR